MNNIYVSLFKDKQLIKRLENNKWRIINHNLDNYNRYSCEPVYQPATINKKVINEMIKHYCSPK